MANKYYKKCHTCGERIEVDKHEYDHMKEVRVYCADCSMLDSIDITTYVGDDGWESVTMENLIFVAVYKGTDNMVLSSSPEMVLIKRYLKNHLKKARKENLACIEKQERAQYEKLKKKFEYSEVCHFTASTGRTRCDQCGRC